MYAVPGQHRVATALAAVHHRCGLDAIDYRLPPAATAYVRSEAEMQRRFVRYPGVVERAFEIARDISFDLSLVAPKLPPFPCPDGHDEMSFLRALVQEGAHKRYGSQPSKNQEDLSLRSRAWHTIEHELAIIESLGFAGYFLVVWDIVRFCTERGILCQGRGSAANSAVCFSLWITKDDLDAIYAESAHLSGIRLYPGLDTAKIKIIDRNNKEHWYTYPYTTLVFQGTVSDGADGHNNLPTMYQYVPPCPKLCIGNGSRFDP
jgi:DNA polymerase III alpha subunit